jgi:hypothetical protein
MRSEAAVAASNASAGHHDMASARIHRNITVQRLAKDLYHFFRCQRPVVHRLGRPFHISRRYIELDLTYRCNLQCRNCNRSCTQAPSRRHIPLERIAAFIRESVATGRSWERIRLLGGEPTLHPDFTSIIGMLMDYRASANPGLRIVVCTNGCGPHVRRHLEDLPAAIHVKNTWKGRRQRLFRPFNVAPIDRPLYRWTDTSCGCRILEDCGLGLTPQGYYPCAIAGAIDRVFGFGRGQERLPLPGDDMREDLDIFCRLCGHFGFSWPTRRIRMSPTWTQAYERYHARCGRDPAPHR